MKIDLIQSDIALYMDGCISRKEICRKHNLNIWTLTDYMDVYFYERFRGVVGSDILVDENSYGKSKEYLIKKFNAQTVSKPTPATVGDVKLKENMNPEYVKYLLKLFN